MSKFKKLSSNSLIFVLVGFAVAFLFTPEVANAADFFITPEEQTVSEGEEFYVSVRIDTKREIINAVESKLSYSAEHLELVGVNREKSILDIWAQRPSVVEDEATVYFLGGATDAVGGSALNVLDIRFRALSPGEASIVFEEGVITAADGRGTDVFSEASGALVNVLIAEEEAPDVVLEPIPEVPEEVEEEIQDEIAITTEVEEPGPLPSKPTVSVPAYPDPQRWYNRITDAKLFYGLPNDVTGVALEVNEDPRHQPERILDGLCCGFDLEPLREGVHFVHIRFQNNEGWGETRHYRIALDVTPPLPVDVDISNERGRNPQPEIEFETQDSLSGIREYRIHIDDEDPIIDTTGSLKLPSQDVGFHTLTVEAVDMAGNVVSNTLEFEILPGDFVEEDRVGERTAWMIVIIILVGIISWSYLRS